MLFSYRWIYNITSINSHSRFFLLLKKENEYKKSGTYGWPFVELSLKRHAVTISTKLCFTIKQETDQKKHGLLAGLTELRCRILHVSHRVFRGFVLSVLFGWSVIALIVYLLLDNDKRSTFIYQCLKQWVLSGVYQEYKRN